MKKGFILTTCCAILVFAGAVPAMAQNQARSERVYIQDLEGIWMHDAYIDALKKSRMPHNVAKKVKPMVIAVRREGRAYPFLSTDFEKAALMYVLDVEPDNKPDSYRLVLAKKNEPTSSSEVEFLWFKGKRDTDRKFRELAFKDPFVMEGKWANYRHVGMELGPGVNGIVLAGSYKDKGGKEWTFTETGQASFPDKSFYFELSINDKTAGCEYFEAEDLTSEDGKSYYGYAWKAGKLQLFRASISKDRVRCETKPFAELTPS
jgi:hypothetical protein